MTSSDASLDRFQPVVPGDLPPGERPLLATLHALPGHEDRLSDALAHLVTGSRAEPGCVEFSAFRSTAQPGEFLIWERFADVDAFDVHLAAPHVQTFWAALAAHSSSDGHAAVQLVEIGPA